MYVWKQVFDQIHTRVSRILAEAKFGESVDGGRQFSAEIVARELEKFSDEELEDMAGEQSTSEELVRNMPAMAVASLAEQ